MCPILFTGIFHFIAGSVLVIDKFYVYAERNAVAESFYGVPFDIKKMGKKVEVTRTYLLQTR